jgi:PleD family two-component response regulator
MTAISGAHILLVEDEAKTAEWIRLYLDRAGMTVSLAADGRAALAEAARRPPDLVLLDVMLPGLGGFEVCRSWRPGVADALGAATSGRMANDGRRGRGCAGRRIAKQLGVLSISNAAPGNSALQRRSVPDDYAWCCNHRRQEAVRLHGEVFPG